MRQSTWITGWIICALLSMVSGEFVSVCKFLAQCILSRSSVLDTETFELHLGSQCACSVYDTKDTRG